MIKELYPPFFMGLGGVIGSGAQFMPWIHVKDLAGLILHSIEEPKVRRTETCELSEVWKKKSCRLFRSRE